MEKKKIDKIKIKQTARKGIFRTIFSRGFIFGLILILQLLAYFLFCSSVIISGNVKYFALIIFCIIIGFGFINKNDNPAYTIMWLFLILGFPVFGIFIYLFVKFQPQVKKLKKQFNEEFFRTKDILIQNKEILNNLKKENENIYNLSNYLKEYSGSIIDDNTEVEYFSSGQEKFDSIKKELQKAEKFIFLEYFIIDKGEMWDTILEILKQKVKEGVEVRVLYDGTCTFSRLTVKYPQELESYGIKCKVFSPIKPFFTTYQNHRDHRKILIIDGKEVYTGGINLADEYIGKIERFGKWKDTSVLLKGTAVQSFTLMFLQVWNMKQIEKDDYLQYVNIENKTKSDGYVVGYGDSPFNDERVGENVYLNMINSANNYIHIITPYLIPSYEMKQALCFAAKRGVDVKIIMPHIPDKKLVFYIARTYYKDFINNGVKIYEWIPGFCHAKMFIVDNNQATVGTINMDFRSLYLHLECGCFLYKNSVVNKIEKDYLKTLNECMEINNDFLKNIPIKQKILACIFKVFSPLL